MAYTGPTFLPTDELTKMHTRRFDQLTAGTPLPSDPLHVKVEGDKFASMLEKVTLPSDQARTHLETSRFDSLIGDTPLPSQQFLEANATPEPAILPPSAPAPQDGLTQPSGAPGDDPIAKTLAFLRGITPGGGAADVPAPQAPGIAAEAPQTPADAGMAPTGFAPIGAASPRPGAQPLHAPGPLDGPDPAGLTRPVIDAVKPVVDTASGALIDQIDRTNQAQAETDQRASAIVGKYQRGEAIPPEEMGRSFEDAANVGMVMSGEPLANAGASAAGRVAGAVGGEVSRVRPGQMSAAELRAHLDETGTSPLWTDYFYHAAPDYKGGPIAPSGRGDQVWLNADAPVQRPGSVAVAIDKSKLDPTLLDTAVNGYPVYKGEIPADAVTVLGKMDHGGRYDGKTLHEAFQAAEGQVADAGGTPPRPPVEPSPAAWRMHPTDFQAGEAGVIRGYRGAESGAVGTERLGGTYVAQDPGYASYFATAEGGNRLQRVEIRTDKPFVLAAGDNAERLAEAEARLGGRPASEAAALARSYRERGMSYVSPQARRWLGEQGYDAVVVHKDLGVPGELGPVAIGLDPAKVRFAGETYDYTRVDAALRRGETVPPEVLADYPDLAGQHGAGPTADVGGTPPRPPAEPPTSASEFDAFGGAEGGGPPVAAKPLKATLDQPMQPDVVLPGHQITPLRKLWDRSRNIIGGMGEAGAELADRVHAWRDDWQVDAARAIKEMPTVPSLSKAEFTNLVDVLERGQVGAAKNAVALNPKVAQAAAEVKTVLGDAYTRAQNAGVDVGPSIESYFPHVFSRETIDTLKREDVQRAARKHLIDTGQAATEEEASGTMYRFLQGGERDRRNGNLEMARTANLPGYEKTKEALYNHVADAYKRLHEVAQFGPDDAIANKLLDRIGQQGDDKKTAVDMFQTIVGAKTYDDLFQGASRAARLYNSTTRLGLSVLSNATQIGNTASVVGVVRAMQAAKGAAWSKAEKAYVDTTGVTLEAVVREMREGGGWSDKVAGVVRPGFNEVEIWNRRTAAIGGRDFARDMAERAAGVATGLNRIGTKAGAVRALEKMGLDAAEIVKRGGTLTPQEEIAAGRNMVERTQFYVDPQDLPGWTQSPIGKMVAQFRTFGYQQTAFVAREAFAEAKAGNVGPLVRLLMIEPMLGAVATESRNAIAGRPPEEDPVKRTAQYALAPLGLVGDAAKMVLPINGQYVPPERRASMAIGTVLGPTAGTAADLATAGYNVGDAIGKDWAGRGDLAATSWKNAGRTVLRQVPVAGQLLTNRVFPYKPTGTTPYVAPGGNRDSSRSSRNSSRDSRR